MTSALQSSSGFRSPLWAGLLWLPLGGGMAGGVEQGGGEPSGAGPAAAFVEVPMRLEGDRIFIPLRLNGSVTCEAVLDTGSEVTLVNKARVETRDLKRVGTQDLQGAFVGGLSAERAVAESLSIGERVYRNVALGIIHHSAGQALERIDAVLGMDLLGGSRCSVEYARNRVRIWAPNQPLPPATPDLERVGIPIFKETGEEILRPHLFAVLNEHTRIAFLLDTASGAPLLVALKPAQEYGLEPAPEVLRSYRIGMGGKTWEFPIRSALYRRLDLGRMTFQNLPGTILDASGTGSAAVRQELVSHCNVLGTTFLKTLQAVHIDAPARMVYLDRARPVEGKAPLVGPQGP